MHVNVIIFAEGCQTDRDAVHVAELAASICGRSSTGADVQVGVLNGHRDGTRGIIVFGCVNLPCLAEGVAQIVFAPPGLTSLRVAITCSARLALQVRVCLATAADRWVAAIYCAGVTIIATGWYSEVACACLAGLTSRARIVIVAWRPVWPWGVDA